MTTPPPMPRMKSYHWFGLCALAIAGVLLLSFHPWSKKATALTDQQAIDECLAYGPIDRSKFNVRSDDDYQKVLHMDAVCEQAIKAIRMKKK